MSELKKTIIIPGDNASDVVGKPILKMVVLGDNLKVAEIANDLSLFPPTDIDRYVLWFKNPSPGELKKLFNNLEDDISKTLAFSVSTKDTVVDYIRKGDKANYTQLDKAFTKAGLKEFN